jgi:hypothetical protein
MPEPRSAAPLGDPPAHLRPDEQSAWLELAALAPSGVLTASDRWAVELTVQLMVRLRQAGKGPLPQANLLLACLARLGMTPVDRSRVGVPQPEEQGNPFVEIATDTGIKPN